MGMSHVKSNINAKTPAPSAYFRAGTAPITVTLSSVYKSKAHCPVESLKIQP